MGLRCRLYEPTNLVRRYLRRFVWSNHGDDCPAPWKYHNAKRLLDTVSLPGLAGEGNRLTCGDLWPHSDPNWPIACEQCGFLFRPTDPWQLFLRDCWRPIEGGDAEPAEDLQPGAMWAEAWRDHYGWLAGADHQANRSGQPHLIVKLPDGTDWDIDGPSTNGKELGPGWSRTGTPPIVTVRPSILTPKYHGFLTDGILEPC